MQTHHVFKNLALHSTQELAAWLGTDIVSRETIHVWPLSCVQRLKLSNTMTSYTSHSFRPLLNPSSINKRPPAYCLLTGTSANWRIVKQCLSRILRPPCLLMHR